MGMTIDYCIHKLDFLIRAYQKLIDENVSNGEVVGTGVRGTWTASAPLNQTCLDMIVALRTVRDTIRRYQLMELDRKADMVAMLEDLKQDIIAEAYGIETDCSDYVVNVADIDMVIQQKINALKGATDEQNMV